MQISRIHIHNDMRKKIGSWSREAKLDMIDYVNTTHTFEEDVDKLLNMLNHQEHARCTESVPDIDHKKFEVLRRRIAQHLHRYPVLSYIDKRFVTGRGTVFVIDISNTGLTIDLGDYVIIDNQLHQVRGFEFMRNGFGKVSSPVGVLAKLIQEDK